MRASVCRMQYNSDLFFHPIITSLTVLGSDLRFPVRRVFCAARNYIDFATTPTSVSENPSPFFFSKPSDAIIDCTSKPKISLPTHSSEVVWETEIVVAIGSSCKFVSEIDADKYIFGYAMGVDLTAKDLMNIAKENGRPWELSKGFDSSGPIGSIVRKEDLNRPISNQRINIQINGVTKQDTTIDNMIWKIPKIISFLSHQVILREGDLIFTGTPQGVGKLKSGDHVISAGEGLPSCEFHIA